MMLNEIWLAGHVGADARDGSTAGKNPTRIVEFPLYHNEKSKGDVVTTTRFRVKVFGGWCDLAADFKKGDNVMVRGRITTSTWESKDGKQHTNVDILPFALCRIEKEPRNGEHQSDARGKAKIQPARALGQRQPPAPKGYAARDTDPFPDDGDYPF
jgi:single-stranded DNA-binding protein